MWFPHHAAQYVMQGEPSLKNSTSFAPPTMTAPSTRFLSLSFLVGKTGRADKDFTAGLGEIVHEFFYRSESFFTNVIGVSPL